MRPLDGRLHRLRVSPSVAAGGYGDWCSWTRGPRRTPPRASERGTRRPLPRGKAAPSAIAESMVPKLVGPSTRTEEPEIVEQVRAMVAATPVSGIVGALGAMRDRPDSTADLAGPRWTAHPHSRRRGGRGDTAGARAGHGGGHSRGPSRRDPGCRPHSAPGAPDGDDPRPARVPARDSLKPLPPAATL